MITQVSKLRKSEMEMEMEMEMEKMIEEEEIVIVGAGVAGLATALALRRVGIRALVLERASGLRISGAALTLAQNALLALDALGVSHKLTLHYSVREKARVTYLDTGVVREVSLLRDDGKGPITVHRRALLESLAGELPSHSIRFSSKPISIDAQTHQGPYIIHLEDGTVISAKVVIGCDGVNSFVARELGLAEVVYSGRWAVTALSVFPEGHGMKTDHVQQYLGEGKRGGIAALNDKEIFWFLVFNAPDGAPTIGDPQEIQKQVTENYGKDLPPPYAEVVRHCDLSTLTLSPLRLRLPWDLIFGNVSRGNMTVAGDAMHPMTPELGQGGCAALEDAVTLARHIGKSFIENGKLAPEAVAGAIEAYGKERRWRAAWLIAGSYLSGWVQSGGKGRLTKMIRGIIFYAFIFRRIMTIADFDCGKLPLLHDEHKTH